MAARQVRERIPSAKVLVLERGPPLSNFIDKGYDDALLKKAATADPDFREHILDENPIVVGTGVGGGTLHFGMQFIDQDGVAGASSRLRLPRGSTSASAVFGRRRLSH